VDLGLIRVRPGADIQAYETSLRQYVGTEAKVLTRDELVAAEIVFIRENAPLDFIFGMGAAVGFFIGFVVVYQILYTEVTNHLPQYATMKAMGFSDRYSVAGGPESVRDSGVAGIPAGIRVGSGIVSRCHEGHSNAVLDDGGTSRLCVCVDDRDVWIVGDDCDSQSSHGRSRRI
jgi:hypothetical protein